jgi:UDP-N-acetylmuramyl pentapeptide phosphotransferase/UDP-N-acetylglucosamine-1-phosphate transferase
MAVERRRWSRAMGAIIVGNLTAVWLATGWSGAARVVLAVLIAAVLFFVSGAIDKLRHRRHRRSG